MAEPTDHKRSDEPKIEALPTADYQHAVNFLREWIGAPSTWTMQTRSDVFDALAVMYRAGRREGHRAGEEFGRHAAASDILARLAVVLRYVEDNSGSEEKPGG